MPECKKIKFNLVGQDGNAFFILGAFVKQARKEGWSETEINVLREEAMSGDYNHLLNVLEPHCDDEE